MTPSRRAVRSAAATRVSPARGAAKGAVRIAVPEVPSRTICRLRDECLSFQRASEDLDRLGQYLLDHFPKESVRLALGRESAVDVAVRMLGKLSTLAQQALDRGVW